jgi:hypothetical protein
MQTTLTECRQAGGLHALKLIALPVTSIQLRLASASSVELLAS